jgi:hypothetical protein
MANSTLTLAQARILAKKINESITGESDENASLRRFVKNAFVRILCREATSEEIENCVEFLNDQAAALSDTKGLTAFSSGPTATIAPASDPQQRARENLVHVLFNHNDFVTVR